MALAVLLFMNLIQRRDKPARAPSVALATANVSSDKEF
jgi:hypothetical protein